jgi:hypothetical protein
MDRMDTLSVAAGQVVKTERQHSSIRNRNDHAALPQTVKIHRRGIHVVHDHQRKALDGIAGPCGEDVAKDRSLRAV